MPQPTRLLVHLKLLTAMSVATIRRKFCSNFFNFQCNFCNIPKQLPKFYTIRNAASGRLHRAATDLATPLDLCSNHPGQQQ